MQKKASDNNIRRLKQQLIWRKKMKQKVSDYIAEYIAQWGIRDVFTVTGGGAMHMNDAFWTS